MHRGLMSLALGAMLLWGCSQPRKAEPQGWNEIAHVDAHWALDFMKQNHPGFVKQVADQALMARWELARREVEARLPMVNSEAAYHALMRGVAARMSDPHIGFKPASETEDINWSGLVLSLQGYDWRVAGDRAGRLTGATLVSCDGKEADEWATSRISAFKDDASVWAMKAGSASWLMLDEGNPFLKRAETCNFSFPDGRSEDVPLVWEAAKRDEVSAYIDSVSPIADAGLSVSKIGEGYWVSVASLLSIDDLTAEIERRSEELKTAPWVVLDLRGNTGGDTYYSNRILRVLAGEQAFEDSIKRLSCAASFFRTSQGNIEKFEAYRDQQIERGGDASGLENMIQKMKLFRTLGLSLWPNYRPCEAVSEAERPSEPVPLEMKGRLAVVVDRNCFSSCLILVDQLSKLGVPLLGEPTGWNNQYMEVRWADTPSGKGQFSTLMKVVVGVPQYGPYQPDVPYQGAMSDTSKLKAWVIDEILPKLG